MLAIFCGEDTVSARKSLLGFIDNMKKQSHTLVEVDYSEIPQLANAEIISNLFGEQAIYQITHLSKKYKGRTKTPFKDAVQTIAMRKDLTLISWERDIPAFKLTSLKRIATSFEEHKPEKSIFELLDSFKPGNLTQVLRVLTVVAKTQEEGFMYAMICKHIKKLIQIRAGETPQGLPPWQKAKLLAQAQAWDEKKLILFYYGLTKIDLSLKSHSGPFSLLESLEILACHYV